MATHEFDTLTVEIDEALCIGSGNCVNMAPGVFRLNEENIVEFVDDPEATDDEEVIEACNLCPVDALIVHNADGEQLVP
jgi:ferredoxin